MDSEIGSLVKALAQARAKFKPVLKNKTATIPMKSGGKYTYKYADIADLIDATAPALSEHGLFVQQRIEFVEGGGRVLATQIFHESGGFLPASYHPLKAGGDVKDVGGELTYIRRYCYSAYLNIASDEDDDGGSPSASSLGRDSVVSKPGKKSPPSTPAQPSPYISEDQLKRYMAIATKHKWSQEAQKGLLFGLGIKTRKEIPVDVYDEVISTLETQDPSDFESADESIPVAAEVA